MILKAYIISTPLTGDNTYKVRIPYLEDNTSTEMIFDAILCITPGIYGGYKVGDCVFVSFEGNKYSQNSPVFPVILGKLYIDDTEEVDTYQIINNLKIKNKVELPSNTKIGDFDASDISKLYQAVNVSLNKTSDGIEGFYYEVTDIIPPNKDYLCFTAASSGSSIGITKVGNPSWSGSFSLDGENWIQYIPGTTGNILLNNIGDKIYFKGNYTDNNSTSRYLKYFMTGNILASGNILSLCSGDDFEDITSIPYNYMFYMLFYNCSSLINLPVLTASTLTDGCYQSMFNGCTSIKLTETLVSEDQVSYRIPISGEGHEASQSLTNMFANTGGTFTGTPQIETIYYYSINTTL